jgi:hypothetical protein
MFADLIWSGRLDSPAPVERIVRFPCAGRVGRSSRHPGVTPLMSSSRWSDVMRVRGLASNPVARGDLVFEDGFTQFSIVFERTDT